MHWRSVRYMQHLRDPYLLEAEVSLCAETTCKMGEEHGCDCLESTSRERALQFWLIGIGVSF